MGLILLQLLGLHPAVAVLAIALPYGALFARVVAEQLDGLPRRNLEALQLTGAPAPTALLMALSPPLWPQLLSYGGYRLECALRSATLLGVFGLGALALICAWPCNPAVSRGVDQPLVVGAVMLA